MKVCCPRGHATQTKTDNCRSKTPAPGSTSSGLLEPSGTPDLKETTMSKLTRKQLFDHLWAAADHLRGAIDSSDYKNYIFGFLFLKRMSDRFEEEALKLIKQGEDEDDAWNDPDYHSFYVPQRARWSEIRKLTTGIGDALNKACIALEEDNSTLEGVLRGINFNDSQKHPRRRQLHA